MTVADTGAGIPADRLHGIFEMFAQVETSRERSQGGLGIGLTLVRRLVEMHGGSVEARSAGAGRGSEFIVRLPIVVEPRRGGARAGGGAVPPSTGGAYWSSTTTATRRHRWRCCSSSTATPSSRRTTARRRYAAAETHRPDVVLLDIGLPVHGRLRSVPPHPPAAVGPAT